MRTQQQQNTTNAPSRSTWYTSGGTVAVSTGSDHTSYRHAPPTVQWPDAVAYRESIQNPGTSLAPPELRNGSVHQDRRGMPVAYTGRFAVVFRISGTDKRVWALRCFTSAPQEEAIPRPDRYRLIASHVSELGNSFVPFKYFDQGIRVGKDWFPIVAMRWANGETLGKFTDRNINNPEALRTLAGTLSALLKRLEDAGVAHGDWQHDNLLVSEDGKQVTLVDYDGMFVPEFEGMISDEIGHPNYQHPGRSQLQFGPHMDRFACLVIQSALLALAHEPGLWARFSDGESLLFKKADFADPAVSPVFRVLREVAASRQDELLADSIARLEDACRQAPEATLEPVVPARELDITKETTEWDALPSATTILNVPGAGAKEDTVISVVPGGAKWWLDGPAITLPDPAKVHQATVGPTGKWFAGQQAIRTGGMQAQAYLQPTDTYAFIERVVHPTTVAAERKHFAASRVGVAVLAAFTVLFLLSLFGRGGSFPFYLFFWVFNLGSLGYANWPRKKIHDELEAEIAKMEKLMNERREKIAARKFAVAPTGSGAPASSFANLQEFINDRMSRTQITTALNIPDLTVSTLRSLREGGVTTALHLQGRTSVPGVHPHEMVALQHWCQELEMRYADEYRQTSPAYRTPIHSAEIARWEQEAAEFERERDRLLREKALFPDVSFGGVYIRRLLGLPEQNATTGTPANIP